MGRPFRSFLPSHPEKFNPNFTEVQKSLKKPQTVQNKYAHSHGTELSILQNNGRVWFRKSINETWKQGTIIETHPQSRSYII